MFIWGKYINDKLVNLSKDLLMKAINMKKNKKK